MLGRLYDKVDGVLGQPIDAGEIFRVEEAASMILAEILDRAKVLYAFLTFAAHEELSEDEIKMAAHLFKLDCDEVRSRAERLGLLTEPHTWTESSGERAFMVPSEKVEVHPYAHAQWHERLRRQVARNPVPEWAKVKPTPTTNGESSPEADA